MIKKYNFPLYPDEDLTNVAQQVLLDEWLEEQEVVSYAQATIKKNTIIVTTHWCNKSDAYEDEEIIKQSFYDFVKNHPNLI